jgi:DNA-binding SARP family transcriptional activator
MAPSQPAVTQVRLKLLGPFEGRFPDGRQAKLETRKSEALLAYLARSCGESHSREQLAAMFWGDRDDAAARHNLRKALASLRRSFEPHELLLADRDSLALNPAAVKVGRRANVVRRPRDRGGDDGLTGRTLR